MAKNIVEKQVEVLRNITEDELVNILKEYGILSNNSEESIL